MIDKIGWMARIKALRIMVCAFVLLSFFSLCIPLDGLGALRQEIAALVSNGSICASTLAGEVVFSLNGRRAMIPASTMKILTAWVALERLGRGYRFETHFGMDDRGSLYVKGFGDPMLVSEQWRRIVLMLGRKGISEVRSIVVDGSFFKDGPRVPGSDEAPDPYNAPVGALSSNFNTLYVRVDPSTGAVRSAERQTPLTRFALERVKKSGLKGTFRINIGYRPGDAELYSGHLLRALMIEEGIRVKGTIERGGFPGWLRPFYIHRSPYELYYMIGKMLKYSNNFIANQLFLVIGAIEEGPPATFAKGSRAFERYLAKRLGIRNAHVVEGSGLSRRNSLTAGQMVKILLAFRRYRTLLPNIDGAWKKTGNLKGVKAEAGYFLSSKRGWIAYAVILNQPFDTRGQIFELLKRNL